MNSILVEKNDRILTVTLNESENANRFHFQLLNEIKEVLKQHADSKEIKIIRFQSSSTLFSEGYDYRYVQKLQELGSNEILVDLHHLAELYLLLLQQPQLTIAEIKGKAVGCAATFALLTDFIFTTPDAFFLFPELHIGFAPTIEIPILLKKFPMHIVRRLFLDGGPFYSEELARLGLVYGVFLEEDFNERVQEFLQSHLTSHSAAIISLVKRMSLDALHMDFNQAMRVGLKMAAHSRFSQEAKIAIFSLLQGKDVSW
jgi:enoyl-CoA hydratase/carnithine racemase